MEGIYKSDFAEIFFERSKRQIYFVWSSKNLSNEFFKKHIVILCEKVVQLAPKSIFVDAREHKYTVPTDVQKWHDEEIVPIYIKAGIKKIAFLTPEAIFSDITTKKIFSQNQAKALLQTAFFKSEKEAEQWLALD
ncbi:MAG: hypothetical protein ACKVOU_02960 [Cytophagales bacterium]